MPPVIFLVALALSVSIGFAFVFGSPILGVPVALLAFGVIGFMEFGRRQREIASMRKFRQEGASQKADFTARDRETQVTEDRV